MSNPSEENRKVTDAIAQRVRAGEDPIVEGWQDLLAGILFRMKPYLTVGRLVTFQHLLPSERAFFCSLLDSVDVSGHVLALYIPPSVRLQMMYANHGPAARANLDYDPENPPDAGIVLASADGSFGVILNALFAYPPTLPAVDVYDHGRLIGGYSYRSIEACRQSLTDLMRTYLRDR